MAMSTRRRAGGFYTRLVGQSGVTALLNAFSLADAFSSGMMIAPDYFR